MKKICFIIPYFGKWPFWIDFFVESCKWNPSIKWLIFTDCKEPANTASNIEYVHMGFHEYCKIVSKKLNIDFSPERAYKLCDIKPALGLIHSDCLVDYDFFAFGDLDVIYGDLRAYFTDGLLKYNCISMHRNRISGHLCLLENSELMRSAFMQVRDWPSILEDKANLRFDEKYFTKVLMTHKNLPPFIRKLIFLPNPYRNNVLFQETYNTTFCRIPWVDGSYEFPGEWYWNQGKLTNCLTGDRQFPYLHFLIWKKRHWEQAENIQIVRVPDYDLGQRWKITEEGFSA